MTAREGRQNTSADPDTQTETKQDTTARVGTFSACRSSTACWETMCAAMASWGVGHFAYVGMFMPQNTRDPTGELFFHARIAPELLDLWAEPSARRVNTPLLWGLHAADPIPWRDLWKASRPRQATRRLATASREMGIAGGLTVPFPFPRGWGRRQTCLLMAVSDAHLDDDWLAHSGTAREEVVDLARRFHQAMTHFPLFARRQGPGDVVADLRVRERLVLDLIGRGHQTATVAEFLGLNKRTVEIDLSNLRGKLRTRTTPHAVARAAGMGMI